MPGGDFPHTEVEQRIAELSRKYSFLRPNHVRRMFRAYGTDAEKIFDGARFAADRGRGFGPRTDGEVDWLKTREWARSADDILWRRSKLGLHMSKDEQALLRQYFAAEAGARDITHAEG